MVREAIKAIPPDTIAALKAARARSKHTGAMAYDYEQDRELIAFFLRDWRNDQLAQHMGRPVSQIKRRLEWMYAQDILQPRKDALRIAAIRAAVLARNAERRAELSARAKPLPCLGITYDGMYCTAIVQSTGPGHRMCDECRRRL
jgi:hypothetical protein